MALQRKGQDWKFGTEGINVTGLDVVTSFSSGSEFSIVTEAKGAGGEIEAVLYGGKKYFFEAEGYGTAAPDLGGPVDLPGVEGDSWITKVENIGSNEDFQKFRVSGIGYEF
jgi:hypothetical protein